MSAHKSGGFRRLVGGVAGLAVAAVLAAPLFAGFVGGRQSAVGGVSISPEGLLAEPEVQAQKTLRADRAKLAKEVPGDLQQFSKLRRISLRKMEEALARHAQNPTAALPEEVKYLGGLQQVRYIFLYPDQNDIVLAGPAEGWKVDALGNDVGLTTGRPVMLLDDLLVALRTARSARGGGISCSIDPTPEGLSRVSALASNLRTIGDTATTIKQIEGALGPQVISVNGVPGNTHFARVMVAADYRMKRLGMAFEPAPVPGLPSYLHLTKADQAGLQNMMPRWWLAPQAEPLLADPDGMSWEIRNLSVKCVAEEDFLKQDGGKVQTGKASTAGQRWADLFTEKYDELSKKDGVFGQLRNVMELAVVAALIDKEGLFDRAQLDARYLQGEAEVEAYNVPRRVDSKATLIKKGRGWLISASGGVKMYPAEIAQKSQSASLGSVRGEAARGDAWWWD